MNRLKIKTFNPLIKSKGYQIITAILFSTIIIYYKNGIYLYKLLHVSIVTGYHQARINLKKTKAVIKLEFSFL